MVRITHHKKNKEFYLIIFSILALTLAHYLTPPDKPLLHDIYRRLYYVPIILAAFTYGLKGALISSITVSLVFIPHVFHRWGHIHLQTMDALFEILLYNVVAWVTGALVESERRQRAKLKETQEELIRANKFKIIGELASGMAHEIRNPLGSIQGALEILKEDYKPEDKKFEFLNILFKEIKRLNRVVTDFLSYARPTKPSLVNCDLNQLVQESLSIIQAEADKKKISLKTFLSPKIPPISADPSQIKQAFLNLLLNSLQAIENSGEISVTSKVEAENGLVLVEFKDNGKGISTENLEKVFVPFFTTKKEGVGLGLGIVERIIQNHNGKVTVESQEGKGTVFTIKLPQKV